jgi:hypothetical protein
MDRETKIRLQMDVVLLKALANLQEKEIRELSGDGIIYERTTTSNAVIAQDMKETLNEQMQHLGHLQRVLARIPVKHVPLPRRTKTVRAGIARIPVKHVPLKYKYQTARQKAIALISKMIELAKLQEKKIRELSGAGIYRRTIQSNAAIAVKMERTFNEQMQHLGHLERVLARIPVKHVPLPRRTKTVMAGMARRIPVKHVPANILSGGWKMDKESQTPRQNLISLMNKRWQGS